MLLLAELHELVVDLLRGFGSAGRLLAGVRRVCVAIGSSVRGGCYGLCLGRRWGGGGLCAGLFGRLGGIALRVVGFGVVLEPHGVGVGRRGASGARRQDELGRLVVFARDEEHVAGGSVEELVEDLREASGAIVAEDALFGDSSGDGDSGKLGDLVEDLVEAAVVGPDGELVVDIGDLRAVR